MFLLFFSKTPEGFFWSQFFLTLQKDPAHENEFSVPLQQDKMFWNITFPSTGNQSNINTYYNIQDATQQSNCCLLLQRHTQAKFFFVGRNFTYYAVCTIGNLKCPLDYLYAKVFRYLNVVYKTVKTVGKIYVHNGRSVYESSVFNWLHKEHEVFKIKFNLKMVSFHAGFKSLFHE